MRHPHMINPHIWIEYIEFGLINKTVKFSKKFVDSMENSNRITTLSISMISNMAPAPSECWLDFKIVL